MPDPTPTPGLSKSLGSRHVAMISIGGVIGAGLFVGSSSAIALAGPAIVLSYLIAGCIVVLVMRMLGEMAVAAPGVGSFTEYVRLGIGDRAGFVTGWLYWYFWTIVIAIEAIAGADLFEPHLGELGNLEACGLALALVAVLTFVNLWSVRSYGEFEFWFASLKVAAIVVFIVVASGYAFGVTSDQATFSNLTDHGGFMPKGGLAVLACVATVFFSLCGSEIASIAAAESNDPVLAVAKISTSVSVRILIFYVLSVLLIVTVVPWTTVEANTSPFVTAMNAMGVPRAALVMNLVILTAVLSCLNSGIYISSRILLALANRGEAPASLRLLNTRNVPALGVIVSAVIAAIATGTSVYSRKDVFTFLLNSSGALMIFVYLAIAFAQVRLRHQLERTNPAAFQVKMWLFPWLSYAAIAAMGAVLVAMCFKRQSAIELGMSTLTLIVTLAAYAVIRKK